MLRIPHCLGIRLRDGGKVVSLTHQPRFTPQKHYFHVSGNITYLTETWLNDLCYIHSLCSESSIAVHSDRASVNEARVCGYLPIYTSKSGHTLLAWECLSLLNYIFIIMSTLIFFIY
jgi:hypothetical protein